MKVLTNSQMRAADEYTINTRRIPSEELMRRAGFAIADEVELAARKLNAQSVLIVCGTGNNGGDGYVCANELLRRGINAEAFALEGNLSDDCKREKARYKGRYSQHICGSIIVDCIFGTGLSREVSDVFAQVINQINLSGAYVISADIPSGLNGDNGLVLGCAVKANKTIAIAEYKVGTFLNDGPDYCGEIIKKDIGIILPESNYAQLSGLRDLKNFFPARRRNSHKGTYGSANLIAGGDRYVGAAALSLEAALKSGCGYVKLTSKSEVKLALAAKLPQVIYLEEPDLASQSIAIGMGCGVSEELYGQIKVLLEEYGGKLVIDADGLNALSKYGVEILGEKRCSVIVTPHVKEFSRLTKLPVKTIENDPIGAAKQFAKAYNVTVLLKSAASIITDGENTNINVFGSTALAKAGSGDMLSGYLCGTLARGLDTFDAAVCAAGALGVAAEIAAEQKTEYCATARDVIKNLHFSVRRLTDKN